MSDCLVYRRGKEYVTIVPCGDKNIFTFSGDSPETTKIIRKIEKIGFRNENEDS